MQSQQLLSNLFVDSKQPRLCAQEQMPWPAIVYARQEMIAVPMAADLSHPCIDLSLKTRALFFSQQPFDICQEAISLPASHGNTPTRCMRDCAPLLCKAAPAVCAS